MTKEDHRVYVKYSNPSFVIISPYADYILLDGNSIKYLICIKEWLSYNFEIKNMDEVEFILNVKIKCDHTKRIFSLS